MDGLARLQANNLARHGRYGDSELLHVSPTEMVGLNQLAQSMGYKGLTTNPTTGLKEAFLFAPLLAPFLAGSIPAMAGMGAIGTGLLAGGLGTAEAALRGMDDPLKQGLMAGLTAGGLSAIGGAATQAAQGATPAAEAAQAAQAAQTAMPATGFMVDPMAGAMTMPQPPTSGMFGVDPMAGAMTLPQSPPSGAFNIDPMGGLPTPPPPPPQPGMMQQMGQNLMGAPGRIMQTTNTLMDNPEAMRTFMRDPRTMMGGVSAMAGMGGSSGLQQQSAFRKQDQERRRKREEDMEEARQRILGNYAAAGRSAPWMNQRFQAGGEVKNPRFLRGEGDGMSDGIPALIDQEQPAALADGEFVVPADVVSALGNGSSEAGARRLHEMMQRVREARTGTPEQAPEIDADGMMPV